MKESADLDEVVECAKLFLRARYTQELEGLQERLDSFDRVNWEGVKQTLKNRLRLLQGPGEDMKSVLIWIEGILSE